MRNLVLEALAQLLRLAQETRTSQPKVTPPEVSFNCPNTMGSKLDDTTPFVHTCILQLGPTCLACSRNASLM